MLVALEKRLSGRMGLALENTIGQDDLNSMEKNVRAGEWWLRKTVGYEDMG